MKTDVFLEFLFLECARSHLEEAFSGAQPVRFSQKKGGRYVSVRFYGVDRVIVYWLLVARVADVTVVGRL